MRRTTERKGNNRKGIFTRELLLNKIWAIMMMLIGCISVYALEGDITIFLLVYPLYISIFLSRENVIG